MARFLAAIFAVAATLALLAVIVPHGNDVDERTVVITALLAYPFAAMLLWAGGRLSRWLMHAILVCGTIMVAVGVHAAGGGRMAGAASLYYLWVAVYIGYYFPWRAVAAHLVVIGASYAALLVIEQEPAGPGLVLGMAGAVTFTAVVVGSLAGRLREQASTDPLTGLPNRRGWEPSLERELARVRRRGTPLCVAVVDLDNFKALNDEQGHLAGDRLLKEVAATWLGLLRDSDVLARYGGDEFGIILPDCYPHKAQEIVDRLCDASVGGATCSAGIAAAEGDVSSSELIGRADRALYQAKAAGGNQAVFASTT